MIYFLHTLFVQITNSTDDIIHHGWWCRGGGAAPGAFIQRWIEKKKSMLKDQVAIEGSG